FDGKTIIHPGQIEACNKAFTPSAEEVAQAKAIVLAFDAPENKGRGVIALDGRMVERLHADIARRTVAIAEASAALQVSHAKQQFGKCDCLCDSAIASRARPAPSPRRGEGWGKGGSAFPTARKAALPLRDDHA